jgi:hypothetical protein
VLKVVPGVLGVRVSGVTVGCESFGCRVLLACRCAPRPISPAVSARIWIRG